jgi:hypothetical protein
MQEENTLPELVDDWAYWADKWLHEQESKPVMTPSLSPTKRAVFSLLTLLTLVIGGEASAYLSLRSKGLVGKNYPYNYRFEKQKKHLLYSADDGFNPYGLMRNMPHDLIPNAHPEDEQNRRPQRTNDEGYRARPYAKDKDGSFIEIPDDKFGITFIGGSTTFTRNTYHKRTDDGHPRLSWTDHTEDMLREQTGNKKIFCDNQGIPGATAKFHYTNLERDVLNRKPNLVVLYLGVNDVELSMGHTNYTPTLRNRFKPLTEEFHLGSTLPSTLLRSHTLSQLVYWYDRGLAKPTLGSYIIPQGKTDNPLVGFKEWQTTMQSIVQLCQANNIDVMLTTFHTDTTYEHHATLQPVNKFYRKLSKELSTYFCDVETLLPEGVHSGDGVHWRATGTHPDGVEIMGNTIAKGILDSGVMHDFLKQN